LLFFQFRSKSDVWGAPETGAFNSSIMELDSFLENIGAATPQLGNMLATVDGFMKDNFEGGVDWMLQLIKLRNTIVGSASACCMNRLSLPWSQVVTTEEKKQRQVKLTELVARFSDSAWTLADRIVQQHRGNSKALIAAFQAGFAGGTKSKRNFVFFKLAVDPDLQQEGRIYGSEELAQKVLSHELRHAQALWDSGVDLLSPLCVLLNIRGHRILACAVLPLDRNSLVYGSNNAGDTICGEGSDHADGVHGAFIQLGKLLHLKNHDVLWGRYGGNSTLIPGFDVEGHIGHDGRYC
jgi:hypothetical protein